MKTGIFKRSITKKITTMYGNNNAIFTTEIKIYFADYYSNGGDFYQTENIFRNNVNIYSANYPANTEYAEKRRKWVMENYEN